MAKQPVAQQDEEQNEGKRSIRRSGIIGVIILVISTIPLAIDL